MLTFLNGEGRGSRVLWNRYNSKTKPCSPSLSKKHSESWDLDLHSAANIFMIAAIESSYVQSLFGGEKKTEAQDARSFSKDGVSSDLQQNSGRDVDMT